MVQPLFSIITSTYNAGAAIEIAAASVRVQHRSDVEYIIVDGASKDDTLAYVERNRDVVTRVISEPDKGIYDALNKGIKAARGKLVGIIGCDDRLVPGALDAVARAWLADPVAIVAGQTLLTDGAGRGVLRLDEPYGEGALVSGIPFGHNAMFATREAYEQIGLYDTAYRISADAHWVHRAIRAGLECRYIPRVLTQFAAEGISSTDGSGVLEESGRAISANFPMLTVQEGIDLLYGVRGWSDARRLCEILARHRDAALERAVRAALVGKPAALAMLDAALPVSAPVAGQVAVIAQGAPVRRPAVIPASPEPVVSFIVPAYNVAGYVERCLESLTVKQSLADVEVIVVDDGSSDDTAQIVERWASRDQRIRLIRQANAGQGAARAVALREARGQYVWCVDSDDRIQTDVLHRILAIFTRHDVDVVVLNFAYEDEDGKVEYVADFNVKNAGTVQHPGADEQSLSRIFSWNCPPWRFVIRRKLLEEHAISFHSGYFYEDHPFALDVLIAAKTAFIDAPPSYYYLRRAGSTVRTLDRRCFDLLPIRRLILDRLRAKGLLEKFPLTAISYILPIEFVQHLVAAEHRQQFLAELWADTRPDEIALVRQFGGFDELRLLDAAKARALAKVDFAAMQSALHKARRRLEISQSLTLKDVDGLGHVEGPYPGAGVPVRFHWVEGRRLTVVVRPPADMAEPHLFLRYRNNRHDQFMLVEQNEAWIEMFPCRTTDLAVPADLVVPLVADDCVRVTIDLRSSDGSARDLSLLIERLDIIDGRAARDPDFDGAAFGPHPVVEYGTGSVIDGLHVDVRVDRQPRTYVEVGENCQISGTFVFERGRGKITIGDRTSIGGGSLLICTQDGGITIGSNVMLSWNVTVIDSNSHSTDPAVRRNDAYDWLAGCKAGAMGIFKDWSPVASAPVVIKDGAWIGFGSAIMKGVTIGEGAIVGSNAVVTRDVPDNCIVAGNPARVVGQAPGAAHARLARQ